MTTNLAPTDLAPTVDFSTLGFQKPTYDLRFADTQYEKYFPVSGVRNVSSIRFQIPRQMGPSSLDMSRLCLAANVKITNSKKDAQPPTDIKSAPEQNFLQTIIKNLR